MTISVQVNQRPRINTVQVSGQPVINTSISKVDLSQTKLEDLMNVAEEVNGLEDGYSLIYDAETETWVTQPLTAENINLTRIDGGTY